LNPLYIIITAYKAQNYIELCLDSVATQIKPKKCPKIKVLIGIDGCKETLSKVKEIRDKYGSNFEFYYSEENHGTYMIKNSLLEKVQDKNSLILFFDADDFMPQNFLDKYYTLFTEVKKSIQDEDIIIRTRSFNIKNEYLPEKLVYYDNNISRLLTDLNKNRKTNIKSFFETCIHLLGMNLNIEKAEKILEAMNREQLLECLRQGNFFGPFNHQYPDFPYGVFFVLYPTLEKLSFFNTDRVSQDSDFHNRAGLMGVKNYEFINSPLFIRRISDTSLVTSNNYGWNSNLRKQIIIKNINRLNNKNIIADRKVTELKIVAK